MLLMTGGDDDDLLPPVMKTLYLEVEEKSQEMAKKVLTPDPDPEVWGASKERKVRPFFAVKAGDVEMACWAT